MHKRLHLLPNILTAFGLTCGLFVIFKIAMTPLDKVDERVLTIAAGFILLAGLFDLLDGALARAMHAESEFGGLFDSLADAISFGVAPSIIFLKTLSYDPGTPYAFFVTSAALVYSVCGVLRLVRFNVQAKKAKGNTELEMAGKKNFTGLPIPAAAVCAISLTLFTLSPEFRWMFDLEIFGRTVLLCCGMTVLGYLMISKLKFPSTKGLQIRVRSFRLVFITVVASVLIFYGMLHHFSLMFFFVSWCYVLTALTLSALRIITGKRMASLEDFEPAEEEEDLFDDISE